MFLKLKQAIRVGGKQYRALSVIDTKELDLSDDEAKVLVLSGAAVTHDPKAPAKNEKPAPGEAKVVKVDETKPAKKPQAANKATTDAKE